MRHPLDFSGFYNRRDKPQGDDKDKDHNGTEQNQGVIVAQDQAPENPGFGQYAVFDEFATDHACNTGSPHLQGCAQRNDNRFVLSRCKCHHFRCQGNGGSSLDCAQAKSKKAEIKYQGQGSYIP